MRAISVALAVLLTALLVAPAATAATDAAEADARPCGGRIDWGCDHYTSPHPNCILYLDLQGTGDGACVIY